MGKTRIGFAFALLGVLALSGCAAGAVQAEPVAKSAAPVESAATTPTAPPKAAPIAAKPAPAADSSPEWGGLTRDQYYLAALKGTWQTAAPTDAEQLAAGNYVCEQIAGGASRFDVVAMSGDSAEAKSDNAGIVGTALYVICPELDR